MSRIICVERERGGEREREKERKGKAGGKRDLAIFALFRNIRETFA